MSIDTQTEALIVGESSGTHLLESAADFRCAINRMTRQAKRSIRLFTQELDHELYDQADFVAIVSQVCRQQRHCQMQILLKNPDKAVHLGHRLVELQKRLPSAIEIRQVPTEHEDTNDEFLIVDDIALVKRFALGTLRGHCEFRSVPDAVTRARGFAEIWARSEPCQSLRRLHL